MARTSPVSIWGSGMISKLTLVSSSIAVSLLLVSCITSDSVRTNDDILIGIHLTERLSVSGSIDKICREVLGHAYPESQISWQQMNSSRVWELTAQGWHGPIVARFEISDGKIVRSVVVSSRERRGKQIESGSYLRQFDDVCLDTGVLSRKVDGITGATVSSKAFESVALLALRLNADLKNMQ